MMGGNWSCCCARVFALNLMALGWSAETVGAETYVVGPGEEYATPSAVPWESLAAGDVVEIHWRAEPYRDKWVVVGEGTGSAPVVIRGIPGPDGQLPVIDGANATTRLELDYWNENRSVIKVGGSSTPPDLRPMWIVIENLDVRGAHPSNSFTDDAGNTQTYSSNAASIHVQRGNHVTIRNCVIRDSGNGLFVGSYDWQSTENVVIEGCHIYGNGIVGSFFEHNTYTEALGIVYRFNRFGPLRPGAGGNNLKDRSAGLVVAYNWIEDGNRQLDLVDAENRPLINQHPSYGATHVYGNVLIESDGEGNSQIGHYGGDSGTTSTYRKGMLYFHHNTVYTTRSGNSTLFRLSTSDENADVRHNILMCTAPGQRLAMLNGEGTMQLRRNWIRSGWVDSHGSSGVVQDDGTQILGSSPGFFDASNQDFRLTAKSAAIDGALEPHAGAAAPTSEYRVHRRTGPRPGNGDVLDLGAMELREAADLDGDGVVNVDDLVALLAGWGPCPDPPTLCADVTGDGEVDVDDLLSLLQAWST